MITGIYQYRWQLLILLTRTRIILAYNEPRMTKRIDSMKINISLLLLIALLSIDAFAMPLITIKHDRNRVGLARVQIMNETLRTLACYVAIDGHKIKFKLTARQNSRWYKATDVRFNHTHFSTWCDYIELHPEYN